MKKVLSCDWLSLFVDCSRIEHPAYFDYNVLEQRSLSFNKITEIKRENRLWGVLQEDPHSTFIDKKCGILKVANEMLYLPENKDAVWHLLSIMNIQVLTVSRWDLACDLTFFDNGLHPHELIKGFMSGKYIKVGKAKFYAQGRDFEAAKYVYQYKPGKYYIPNDFEVLGDQENQETRFSYLAFGSRSSDVRCYLYNKSKELREQHDKDYIKQLWRKAGWKGECDVWRVEFSIKGNRMKIVSKDTAEILNADYYNCLYEPQMKRAFNALQRTYFDFRINTGQVRKDREERLLLFQTDFECYKLHRLTYAKDCGKSDKIFLKKLANSAKEIYDDNVQYELDSIHTGREFAARKGLTNWCAEMGIDFGEERERRCLLRQRELFPTIETPLAEVTYK